MRIAMAMWPAPAHVNPFVPLARALESAGHEVVVTSHPSIGDTVTGSGLSFVPACPPGAAPVPQGPGGAWPQARETLESRCRPVTAHLDEYQRGVWDTYSQFFLPSTWDFTPFDGDPTDELPVMDGLVSFFRTWEPDLVIWDPCFPGAGVAARACGARHARFTGPDYVGWSVEAFDEFGSGENPMVTTIKAMATKYDVPIDRETLFGQWTINPMPESLTGHLPVGTTNRPIQWLPHSDQTMVPEGLLTRPDRPRVILTLGVSSRAFLDANWDHVPPLLEALGGLDVDVVATLNSAQLESVEQIPDNVTLVEYVPLDAVLGTCDVVIHHGGLATMAAAGHAGVAQLVVDFPDLPIAAEPGDGELMKASRYALAPVVGQFLESRDAGSVLDMSRSSVDQIRAVISETVTSPPPGTGNLRAELKSAPSPAEFAADIEQWCGDAEHSRVA